MKTFGRLIRRYVLLAAGISLLVVVVVMATIIWVSLHFGLRWQEQFAYSYTEIADHLQRDDSGRFFFDEQENARWMDGYAWGMVLDEKGQVIWNYQLPEELNHSYTASEIAAFSRWYLKDYPVFCQIRDYGLLVLGMPKGSTWKYNFWTYPDLMEGILYGGSVAVIGIPGLILAFCLIFSWRGTRSLQTVSNGLDALAEGRTVELPTRGFAGAVAEKLNQTSAQLRSRNEIIRRRDTARTNWIAGVSHDIRTPLSLILGWAEQLQQDKTLPESARRKASDIQTQSEKITALIEDLNLTSKLQYGAQPLRRRKVHAGAMLRRLVADFCNGPMAQSCEVALTVTPAVEETELLVDDGLLARAFENILGNSVRHNAAPVHCEIQASVDHQSLCVTITDDGVGYPPAVLETLQTGVVGDNTPHILGLHVVEQIVQAHGGTTAFCQNEPHGSKVILQLPRI